jgi:hypothetical protein
MNTPSIEQLDLASLSTAERLLLAQELWDSVVGDVDAFPMTAEERRWIEQRVANAREPDTRWHTVADVLAFARRDRSL